MKNTGKSFRTVFENILCILLVVGLFAGLFASAAYADEGTPEDPAAPIETAAPEGETDGEGEDKGEEGEEIAAAGEEAPADPVAGPTNAAGTPPTVLYVGSKSIDTTKASTNSAASGNYSYDPATNTLTLNSAVVTGTNVSGSSIYAEGGSGLTVKLKGTCKLTPSANVADPSGTYDTMSCGISTDADLIITGTGSLTITTKKADLTAGIVTDGALTVESTVNITCADAAMATGVVADSLELTGTLDISMSKGDDGCVGAAITNDITVNEGTLGASAGASANVESVGIQCSSLTTADGTTVRASSANAGMGSIGLNVLGDIEAGENVTFNVGASNALSDVIALSVDGNFSVKDRTFVAGNISNAKTLGAAAGIVVTGILEIDGGTVTALACESEESDSVGIAAGTIVMTSGSLTADAGAAASGSSVGIDADLAYTNGYVKSYGEGAAFVTAPTGLSADAVKVFFGANAASSAKATEAEVEADETYTENKYVSISEIISPTDISIDPASVEITKGASTEVDVLFTPDYTSEYDVTVQNSDPTVITVTKGIGGNGVLDLTVTGLKPGTSVITVVSDANPSLTAQCTVTVKEGVPVKTITYVRNGSAVTKVGPLAKGTSATLTISVNKDASNKDLNVVIQDNTVAKLTSSGNSITVTGLKGGITKVVATAKDGSGTTAELVVKVNYTLKMQNDGVWYYDKSDFTTFYATSDMPYSQFEEVTVDGKVVDPKYYTLSSQSDGTAAIEFKESYMKSLSHASHMVKFLSYDGVNSTEFKMYVQSKNSPPKTGDTANMALWAALAGVGAVGAAVLITVRRRKEF